MGMYDYIIIKDLNILPLTNEEKEAIKKDWEENPSDKYEFQTKDFLCCLDRFYVVKLRPIKEHIEVCGEDWCKNRKKNHYKLKHQLMDYNTGKPKCGKRDIWYHGTIQFYINIGDVNSDDWKLIEFEMDLSAGWIENIRRIKEWNK